MRGLLSMLTVVAFLGVIVLAAVPESPQIAAPARVSPMAAPAREPLQKLGYIGPPRASSEVKQLRPPDNIVQLSHPADEREVAIAALLKSQPTPSLRATYFQSILNRDDFHLARWELRLREVRAEKDVTRFNVLARPVMDGPMIIFDVLEETYELHGDNLELVKTDPPVDPTVVKQFGFQIW